MEDAGLLLALDGVVRRIEVEHDPLGRLAMGIPELSDQGGLDGSRVRANPPVTVIARWGVFQAVQYGFASQRRTAAMASLQTTRHRAEHWVAARIVMVIQTFGAQPSANTRWPTKVLNSELANCRIPAADFSEDSVASPPRFVPICAIWRGLPQRDGGA